MHVVWLTNGSLPAWFENRNNGKFLIETGTSFYISMVPSEIVCCPELVLYKVYKILH